MNVCHACQRELDEAALAARRCSHCGAVVRVLAKRTIEDKRFLGDERNDATIDSSEIRLPSAKLSDPERKNPTIPEPKHGSILLSSRSRTQPCSSQL
jgi:hypothetical protein